MATKKITAPQPAEEKLTIEIPPLQRTILRITLRGTSEFIAHRFDAETHGAIADKQEGKARAKKSARDPEKEYMQARYLTPDGKDGLRALMFKCAMVSAAQSKMLEDLDGMKVRKSVFVRGDIIPINGKRYRRDDKVVNPGSGGSIPRYRPAYKDWSVDLEIEFLENMISVPQMVQLLETAGYSVGVGDWRPERKGDFGRWELDTASARIVRPWKQTKAVGKAA